MDLPGIAGLPVEFAAELAAGFAAGLTAAALSSV
jgi:hypothetical protein